MTYTIEEFAEDCRAALRDDASVGGLEKIRDCCSRACLDDEFVATHFPEDNKSPRKVLYEDPDFEFCILAHVHEGASESRPHDHGPSWAIYAQVAGETEMSDWNTVPDGDEKERVERVGTYTLRRGDAHLYERGAIHSPRREAATKLVRIEGKNMDGVKRRWFDLP